MQPKDLIGELRRFLHDARVVRSAGILLAVSGGRDSMALAKAFTFLNARSDQPWHIHAAVVDHALRKGSAKEARFVRDTLLAWGVGCELVTLSPPKAMPQGALAWARDARYASLEALRRALQLAYVATAHHMDDQAETLILRLIRGAAPGSLGAMRPRQGALLRPLLGVRRADVDRFVKKHGVPYVDDPTNDDPGHPRTRVRREVMPLLQAIGGADVATRLSALAADLAEDDAALAAALPALGRGATVALAKLSAMPAALQRRAIWTWLQAHADPHALGRAHVDQCLVLVAGADPKAAVKLPGGRVVVREPTRVRVRARQGQKR